MNLPGRAQGGAEVLESGKAAHLHMKEKGSLGIATLVMRAHDMIDVVKVILPSASDVRQAQETNDWAELWVRCLTALSEADSSLTSPSLR